MLKYSSVKTIDVSDWDSLVQETYGKPYEFQQQNGCQDRGTVPLDVVRGEITDDYPTTIPFEINGNVMGVKFTTWLNTSEADINAEHPEDYPNANRLFWERNFYPGLEVVANDLCNKGLIEPGEYVIDIDW